MGDPTEALALYERALAVLDKTVGPEHPRSVNILSRQAGLLEQLGQQREAGTRTVRAAPVSAGLHVSDT